MDSTLPLHRQLSSRFLLLALSFILLCFLASVLYFQHEQDVAVLKYQQLPSIEKYNQRQLLLIKNDRLINEVLNSQYAAKFGDYYQTINEDLTKISALSRNNRQVLKQLTLQWQQQADNANSLSESYRRNIQLKDNVIIQLTLVADSLSNLVAAQALQQNDLYRQITQDKLTARITATKAKVLSHLVSNLNINREFHRAVIDSLVMFNQLDLHYDLINFDYIQQKTHHEITHWLASTTNILTKNSNENVLFEQITVLNDLLFSEQNTFEKWREQLHRANAFQAQLVTQKNQLMPLLDKALVVQSIKPSMLEREIVNLMERANIGLQAKHYIWLVAVIFALLAIIFISALISLHRRIKHFGAQSTAVVEEWVASGEVAGPVPALEIASIINSVEQLSRPEHSEADFRKQQQRHQIQIATMSRHSGHVFWQFPALSKQKQQQLRALLGSKLIYQHWRQYFSRVDVRAILSIAKQAKNNNSVEKIALVSLHGKAIVLTIEHLDGLWCGSLCNAEEYRRLEDSNTQLQQELKQQSQADKFATIANSDDLTLLISNAMQQRQMLSLAQGNEQIAYQQLSALMFWSEQQKTSAQLRCDDFVLSLSTVNITNEIDTVLANVGLYQVSNNNAIYLNITGELNSPVTLESEFFQAMIKVICNTMLSDQQGVVLDVNVQALELSVTQQILRMSFQVNQPINTGKLSQVINALVADDESSTQVNHASKHYLRDLQLMFDVNNNTAQQLETAESFVFELPLALAESATSSSLLRTINQAKAVKLTKTTLLVIATDKSNRERICQQFADSKAVVETMQDLLLFTRQFSVKRLTKNRLDVVILSPEVYLSDYDLITQHVASLPTNIQPKIMVIQPFNCTILQRTGLFSVSNFPWFAGELVENVAQLIKGSDNTNLLAAKETFTPYRFVPTQVEVLLAVAELRAHQDLLRVLSWLGLQVTVISQQETLERLWHSGRYLVVISEFLPFKVDVGVPSTLVRGIFTLTNEENSTNDSFSKLNLDESWQRGCLAPTFDIGQLSQQLAPWLMPETDNKANNIVAIPSFDKSEENALISALEVDQTDTEREPETSMVDLEQSLDFSLMLEHCGDKQNEHDQVNKARDEAFNLAVYAENQGTADLAAFMLDDYIADIKVNVSGLNAALQQQDVNLALSHLKLLMTLAKIIAAQPLLKECLALKYFLNQNINERDAKSEFSLQQKEQLQQQLNHLTLCLEQLTEFAESI